jgi:GTP-binding protein
LKRRSRWRRWRSWRTRIFSWEQGLWTLFLKICTSYKAGNGGDGSGDRSTGADGDDKFIEVPLGTVVKDKETGEILFEITEDGEKQVLSRGGKGGLGNWHFRSSTNQTHVILNRITWNRDG